MNNEQFILQIKQNNQTILSAIDVDEELSPLVKLDVMRNSLDESIAIDARNAKYKYCVRSNYPPDISLLRIGGVYEIWPTMVFRESKGAESKYQKVADSIEIKNNFIFFRPIFNMVLTNYQVNNSKNFKWIFEFEEA